MKITRVIILLALVLLPACDTTTAIEVAKHKAAEKIATQCVEQMASCDDWNPIEMSAASIPIPVPVCDKFDYDCKEQQDSARSYNRDIDSEPRHSSPCQQKADACTDLVRALTGYGYVTSINNHYRKN